VTFLDRTLKIFGIGREKFSARSKCMIKERSKYRLPAMQGRVLNRYHLTLSKKAPRFDIGPDPILCLGSPLCQHHRIYNKYSRMNHDLTVNQGPTPPVFAMVDPAVTLAGSGVNVSDTPNRAEPDLAQRSPQTQTSQPTSGGKRSPVCRIAARGTYTPSCPKQKFI